MDPLGLGALCLVTAAWLALGTLSGIDWPPPPASFWLPRWALRVMVGAVLTAVAELVLALLGVGFGAVAMVLVVAGVGACLLRVVAPLNRGPAGRKPIEAREGAGWLLLGVVLLASIGRSLLVPEAGWDAYSHWGLRAQAFALARTIVDAHSEHEYYPPLVPLLEAWLYLNRGSISIDLGKTIWAVLGSAFAICLTWHLRLSLRVPWPAPFYGTAIVVTSTALLENLWMGQADLALTAFLTLATLALVQWQRAPSRAWLVQAAVFAMAAALTKYEGVPRLAVIVVALGIDGLVTRRWASAGLGSLVLVGASCLGLFLWLAFELTHGITSNAEHLGQFQPLALGGVLVSLAVVLAGVRTGGGVLVAMLAWIVAGKHMFSAPLRLISLVVLGQLAATLLAFLLSDTSPDVEVRTSATRLFGQFLPLALFAAAVGLSMVRPALCERDL